MGTPNTFLSLAETSSSNCCFPLGVFSCAIKLPNKDSKSSSLSVSWAVAHPPPVDVDVDVEVVEVVEVKLLFPSSAGSISNPSVSKTMCPKATEMKWNGEERRMQRLEKRKAALIIIRWVIKQRG
jgi:hypothetical protein